MVCRLIILYLHLLISIGRKPTIDNMSALVDPNKWFGPLWSPVSCAVVSLSAPHASPIWTTADYQTRSPSHTAGLNFGFNKGEAGQESTQLNLYFYLHVHHEQLHQFREMIVHKRAHVGLS